MKKFLYSVSLFGVVIVLAGCQTMQGAQQGVDVSGQRSAVEDSEDLLNGEGKMDLVEDKKEMSPIEQHRLAKGEVDPAKINKKNKYTKNIKDIKAKDEENVRVVRVEGDISSIEKEMKPKGLKVSHRSSAANEKSLYQAILDKVDAKREAEKVVKSTNNVQSVRIGQHPGKTRIVFDVDQRTSFHARLKDGGRLLVVELPKTGWEADKVVKVSEQSIISGYSVHSSLRGSEVRIALNAPGKIVYKNSMKPSGKFGYRVVLDIREK